MTPSTLAEITTGNTFSAGLGRASRRTRLATEAVVAAYVNELSAGPAKSGRVRSATLASATAETAPAWLAHRRPARSNAGRRPVTRRPGACLPQLAGAYVSSPAS